MDETFLSEVHMNIKDDEIEISNSTLNGADRICLSRFKFHSELENNPNFQNEVLEYDSDGDIIAPNRYSYEVILLEHTMSTPLATVGLQVWSGSLLLGDYLLSRKGKEIIKNKTTLELGAGTGLCSIIAARHSKRVLATDYKEAVLAQCHQNLDRNKNIISGEVRVRRLDWTEAIVSQDMPNASPWTLQPEDGLSDTEVIIAADVIYDDNLTDAFFKTLRELNSQCRLSIILIALEKRLNFTLNDLDVACPMYDHFLECLSEQWAAQFKKLSTDFRQYLEYNRDESNLEIWAILPMKT